jgi:hypothetical protein
MEEMAQLIRDGAANLSAIVQSTAPAVWDMTKQMVVNNATINIIALAVVGFLLCINGVLLKLYHRRTGGKWFYEDNMVGIVWCSVVLVILGIWLLCFLNIGIYSIKCLLSPDYYTLQKIVGLVK